MLGSALSRLTFSNVVALVALFVALGGTVYAVNKIDGSTIKKRTIAAKKLEKNTLTGKEIDEARLKRVPKAASAGDAKRLDGQVASDFVPADKVLTSGSLVKLSAGQERVLIEKGPFSLRLTCEDAGGGAVNATVFARTTEPGSFNTFQEMDPDTDILLASAGGQGFASASASFRFIAPSGTTIDGTAQVAVNEFGAPCAATASGIG